MKNKKKIALGATALAAVMVAAGTFAWFTTTDKVKNTFSMDNFDVTITEDFDTPDVPLTPGADITKVVGITNSGNVPVLVRVKLEEALSLLTLDEDNSGKLKVVESDSASAGEGQVPVLISDKMIQAYKTSGYKDFTSKSITSLNGLTVLQKEAKDDNVEGTATVYSYLAYVTAESSDGSGYHHLVTVTPTSGAGTASPTEFTVKYLYNEQKPANDKDGTKYTLESVHGASDHDTKLNGYYGTTFHDGAVKLNFAENVSLDGTVSSTDTNWVLMSDGYFYYTKALDGESISAPLLESVSINESAGNALKGATYTITPEMQAVQMDWAAAKNTWTELNNSNISSIAAVGKDSAEQLVYNIVNSDTHVGYYAGT